MRNNCNNLIKTSISIYSDDQISFIICLCGLTAHKLTMDVPPMLFQLKANVIFCSYYIFNYFNFFPNLEFKLSACVRYMYTWLCTVPKQIRLVFYWMDKKFINSSLRADQWMKSSLLFVVDVFACTVALLTIT